MYSGSAFVILNAQNLQGIEEKMIWSENVRRPERARESRKEGRVQLTHTHTHTHTQKLESRMDLSDHSKLCMLCFVS